MSDAPGPSLAEVLDAASADLEAAERLVTPGATEWSMGGIVFAALSGERAEFRLARPVVAAALRTPDTSPSSRGPDWVAFAPAVMDGHAADRAAAWLASAWRRADGES